MSTEKNPFRIESLHSIDTVAPVVICRCDRLETAREAFRWAREQHPRARLILREGDQIIADTAASSSR